MLSNNLTLVKHFYYHLRSSRKEVSKMKYYHGSNSLKKHNNKPIMFVRAPKHFKTGKQHIFFFKGYKRTPITLKFNSSCLWVLSNQIEPINSFLLKRLSVLRKPDLLCYKLTYKVNAVIKFK